MTENHPLESLVFEFGSILYRNCCDISKHNGYNNNVRGIMAIITMLGGKHRKGPPNDRKVGLVH
jgi:hypothetical protein